MSVFDDVQAYLKQNPDFLKQALSGIPGMGSLTDIASNAGPLIDEAAKNPTVQAMANGVTGAPIMDNVPNPGNPVSGLAEGMIAPMASNLMSDASKPDQAPNPAGDVSMPPAQPDASTEAPGMASVPQSAPPVRGSAPKTPEPITIDPSEDQRRREANEAALEHKRRMGLIPNLLGGFSDAVATGAQGLGIKAATDTQDKIIASQKADHEKGKTDFEAKLRKDPNSDISKQYQSLLAEMSKKSVDDPAIRQMSAADIAERLPMVEKMMERQSREDMERLRLRQARELAARKGAATAAQTTGQKAVDRAFAKTYDDFVVQGGYGKAINQLSTLQDILDDLKGGKKNLSGAGFKLTPDITERVLFPDKIATQQAAEQAIQEGLRATLGAQFTEKEGQLFLQRGYDPNLDEKQNAAKLERAMNQLKLMIMSKRKAADYYEENGTLDGYKGDLYTIKNGEMTKASSQDFMKMLEPTSTTSPAAPSASPAAPKSGPRKTKSGVSYTVG